MVASRARLSELRAASRVRRRDVAHSSCWPSATCARGLTPAQARAARADSSATSHCSSRIGASCGGSPPVERVVRSARDGLRQLRRSPGFTAAAVLALALGIGVSSAIFTLLDQLVVRALPVADAQRLVMIWSTGPNLGDTRGPMASSFPLCQQYQREARALDTVFCRAVIDAALTIDATTAATGADPVRAELVSGNYFEALRVGPSVGRVFSAACRRLRRPRSPGRRPRPSLLARPLRRRRARRRPHGASERSADGGRRRRSGGLHRRRCGAGDARVAAGSHEGADYGDRGWAERPAIRVPPDFRATRAGTDGRLGPRLAAGRCSAARSTSRRRGRASPARRRSIAAVPRSDGSLVELAPRRLFGIAAAVRHGAVRADGDGRPPSCSSPAPTSPGCSWRAASPGSVSSASDWRLARGAARSSAAAGREPAARGRRIGARARRLGPRDTRAARRCCRPATPCCCSTPNRMLASCVFGAAMSLVTALAFGLLPALQATRIDPTTVLRIAPPAPSAARRSATRLRRVLVVAQVTLSFLLLVGAGLFTRTLVEPSGTSTPASRRPIVSSPFSSIRRRSATRMARSRQFYADVHAALEAAPGVDAAAYAWMPLLQGWAPTLGHAGRGLHVARG